MNTIEEVKKKTEEYRRELASYGREPKRADPSVPWRSLSPVEKEDHLHNMCVHILDTLIPSGRDIQAALWLGWINAAMAELMPLTINDVRTFEGVREIP